ncbi:MAG: DegT/DnrJ/EryC1/StrS family aminotransferase [Gaiellaceae bacterium]
MATAERAESRTTHVPVPFLDLGAIHRGLRAEILSDISALIETGAFANGPQVAEFEQAFAGYCGSELCVGVASGLDALRIGLVAAGIEHGEEVIVPAATFAATFEAVTQAGGRPVVVDIDESDYCMDVSQAAAAATARTSFLLPVHLYGQLADMRALDALAAERGLAILEDACQAHGGVRDGIRAGQRGLAAAFSFYPGKNLGAFGDGGALTTSDPELARRARALREHGQFVKYRHALEGWTARLDTIQAIVLLHKLPLLDEWNQQRRAAAAFYASALEGVGDLRLPHVAEGSDPVWHLYVVRSADRDGLAQALKARGIASGWHYPEAPHLSEAYEWLGHRPGSFPLAEALCAEALSLPIFPGISERQLHAVAEAVSDWFAGGR